ncbi:MAG: DNA topoisomerase I [Gammaproteobacteria bacterium]|nr:DNA topoisomerase I [Gammaproteobacteria bacterium]
MSKNLVIVESPAKGKTIEKYLGKDYKVLASYGHVRDLLPKEGAVDPANDFAMKYQMIERNEKHVNAIKKALKKADALLLATDPDREGEAISWHLVELLKDEGALEGKEVKRVVFHEITKRAIQEAVDNPRTLGQDLINAQQARRALDYLVGFNLSPLLWRKIRRGLSAGRVQSPALRMICERENEIEAFVPQEYWSIVADLEKDKQAFTARLSLLDSDKVKQFTVTNGEQAESVKAMLLAAANGELVTSKVEKKQRKRNPTAPFTTSTLQQEASRKLGFGAQRTMRIAQKLYEGIDVGDGQEGLITYMRTDSVTLSQDCVDDLRSMIPERYGKDYLPEQPNTYKNKSKNAQEAHECIRPTSVRRFPEAIKQYLDADQYKLYNLIWKRTVASQMIFATIDQVAVDFACGEGNQFRANGSTVKFPGFMTVYLEDEDDKKKSDDDDKMLPDLKEGDRVPLHEIKLTQHFTEPPPRFSEASLVKALEEYGIGRPSTYASIISTLQSREYVEIESRRFFPTDTGRVVSNFLSNHFSKYVSYDFTAELEDELDAVSRGEKAWVPLLDEFWTPFKDTVDDKLENVSRDEAVQARELGTDPKSGKPISVRIGRYGAFVQIGTREDEEKPTFAGLRPGQRMNTITLEDALQLFELPRHLGESPEGEKISASIGRFGPYIKYDSKFVSLKEDDPYTVTLERALEVVAAKKEADANRIIKTFEGTEVQLLNGRWGPYISDGHKNAKIPKDMKEKPLELTLEFCLKALEEAPEPRGRGKKKAAAKKTAAKKTAAKKTSKKKASKKKAASKKKSAAKKKSKAKAKKTTSKKKTSAKKKAVAKKDTSETAAVATKT